MNYEKYQRVLLELCYQLEDLCAPQGTDCKI